MAGSPARTPPGRPDAFSAVAAVILVAAGVVLPLVRGVDVVPVVATTLVMLAVGAGILLLPRRVVVVALVVALLAMVVVLSRVDQALLLTGGAGMWLGALLTLGLVHARQPGA